MAEAQPVDADVQDCQHCYAKIKRVAGTQNWWRSTDPQQAVVCESTALDVKHRPMPQI